MPEFPIPPEVVEAAKRADMDAIEQIARSGKRTVEPMGAAIRAALDKLGLREERVSHFVEDDAETESGHWVDGGRARLVSDYYDSDWRQVDGGVEQAVEHAGPSGGAERVDGLLSAGDRADNEPMPCPTCGGPLEAGYGSRCSRSACPTNLMTAVRVDTEPSELSHDGEIIPGYVWCGVHGDANEQQVIIVAARAGRRVRLRRLTGAAAGKEITVSRHALRTAFRPLAMYCGRTLIGSGDDTYDPVCELPSGHDGRCRSSSAIDQHRLPSATSEGETRG